MAKRVPLPLRRLRRAFRDHERRAARRGIPFLLTYHEWQVVWRASGRLRERGRGVGRYVMARPGDRGPYALGNVKIITFEENCSEGQLGRRRTVSEETRARISAGVLRAHQNDPGYGFRISEAAIRRWREGLCAFGRG